MASLNLGENVEIDTELIKKAYSLAVKAHSKSLEKAYNVEESRRSSDPIIISFSGCWSENGWYDGEPFGVMFFLGVLLVHTMDSSITCSYCLCLKYIKNVTMYLFSCIKFGRNLT